MVPTLPVDAVFASQGAAMKTGQSGHSGAVYGQSVPADGKEWYFHLAKI
jgi:hypothetical protein